MLVNEFFISFHIALSEILATFLLKYFLLKDTGLLSLSLVLFISKKKKNVLKHLKYVMQLNHEYLN